MNTMGGGTSAPSGAHGYRALVVDDEAPLAEVVARDLERDQFEATVVVANGSGAISVARVGALHGTGQIENPDGGVIFVGAARKMCGPGPRPDHRGFSG